MSIQSKRLANDIVLAAVLLTRQLRTADKQAKMSGPQASALAAIVYSGKIKIVDLAKLEQVRSPTIVQVVNQLEALGLAKRQTDPADGRVSWVRATDKGKKFLHEGQERRIAPLTRQLDKLNAPDRTILAQAVELLQTMIKREQAQNERTG